MYGVIAERCVRRTFRVDLPENPRQLAFCKGIALAGNQDKALQATTSSLLLMRDRSRDTRCGSSDQRTSAMNKIR